jgi:hypothetical protein
MITLDLRKQRLIGRNLFVEGVHLGGLSGMSHW